VTTTPKPRWFQFSLRTLLVVFTVFCGPGGWIAYERQNAKQGAQSKKTLESLGGKFEFDARRPVRPRWLRAILGDNRYADAVAFTLSPEHSRDQMLLVRTGRRYLGRNPVQPSGESIAGLAHFPRLKTVDLDWTMMDDRALADLAAAAELVDLSLTGTKISDSGLRHLRHLEKLEKLRLGQTMISDAGLEHLSKLVKLRELDLSQTAVTDLGLASLKGLPELEVLNLSGTLIQGPGLAHVERLTRLHTLNLQTTGVGSAELKRLARMRNLKVLYLYGTKFSKAERNELRRPFRPARSITEKANQRVGLPLP
jgi:hypothetical protein